MFSLAYSASYDPYNTIFRMLSLLTAAKGNELSVPVLKIADFYLCFPWLLSELRTVRNVPGIVGRRNAIVRSYKKSSFDVLPTSAVLFDRMGPIQSMAINAMVARGLVVVEGGEMGTAKLSVAKVSTGLRSKIDGFVEKRDDLFHFLTRDLPQMRTLGADGLKHRSGLGEYRYDNV